MKKKVVIEKIIDVKANIGDEVKVVDPGKAYPTYVKWFDTYEIPYEQCCRYSFGAPVPKGIHGIVVEMNAHECLCDMLYLINCNGVYYLVGEDGLELI